MIVHVEAQISAAPDRLFAYVARWEDQPAWMQDAARVRVLSKHSEGPGVRMSVRTRIAGLPVFTEELEVIEWDPPRRLVVKHCGVVRGTGEWRFDPEPGGTRFRWTERLELPVPLLGNLALLAYRPFMRRLMQRSLRALAARV